MLIEGKWQGRWHPVQKQDDAGRFVRQVSTFRSWVTADGRPGPEGQTAVAAEAGRFRLYAALICPWASRILFLRSALGLQEVLPVTIVEPALTDEGWAFSDDDADPALGAHHLHQLYTHADPAFTGRATVPVLWDQARDTIVNNESADLLRILPEAFAAYTDVRLDLRPADLEPEIAALNEALYRRLNNGVYRAGFAQTQAAHDEAAHEVFACLDELEARLDDGRLYLFGERFTETDIRLFVTLVRFDVAYHGLFKLNRRRIADYPRLFAYQRRLLDRAGVAETVNVDHIQRGYYSIRALNPTGIVPTGPVDPFGEGA